MYRTLEDVLGPLASLALGTVLVQVAADQPFGVESPHAEAVKPGYVYREIVAESATSPSETIATIQREVFSSLVEVQAEELEDGMTVSLAEKIVSLLRRYGEIAIMAMNPIISSERLAPEVISHTLRWLGRLKHPESFRFRLSLLKRGLLSSSPIVRDGAALGLAALGSRQAIPALHASIGRERLRGLRRDMQQALKELERGT